MAVHLAFLVWGGCFVQCILWGEIIREYEYRWGMNIFAKAWATLNR
jgi:hypothetical protein